MKSTAEQIAYYSQRLDEFGPTWEAADWGSELSQHRRLDVLVEVIDQPGTILDVGCGTGVMINWVRHWGPSFYCGWDIVPPLIQWAKAMNPAWNERFFVRDLSESTEHRSVDYVLASGLFTYGDIGFFWRAIKRMWDLCRCAVAFNVLSQYGQPVQGEFRAHPGKTLEYCMALTPRVTLRHDYLPHDFTVYLYRP